MNTIYYTALALSSKFSNIAIFLLFDFPNSDNLVMS